MKGPDPDHQPNTCEKCRHYHDQLRAISRMTRQVTVDGGLLAFRFPCPIEPSVSAQFYVDPGAEPYRYECPCGASDELHAAALLSWQPPPPPVEIPLCPDVWKYDHNRQACPGCQEATLWARDEAKRRYTEAKAAETADEWAGISGDQFDPSLPEPVPTVLEFAPGRYAFAPGINIVYGARSALKTWLCLKAVADEVSRGNRALIVDFEMSFEEVLRRLYTLGMTVEQASLVVHVHPSGPPSDIGRARLAQRFPDLWPPSVVVIDSVGMGMGLSGFDSNSDTDSARWADDVPRWMRKQWPDAVILLIDHVPKGAGASATDPIGSQRKGAYADGLYLASVMSTISRATRGRGRVVIHKDRKGLNEEGAALFDFEFGGGGPFTLTPSDPQLVPIDLSRAGSVAEGDILGRIARYVGEHEGAKVEEVRTALSVHSASFTAYKDTLVRRGVIEHRPRQGLFKGAAWQEQEREPTQGALLGEANEAT